MRAGVELGSRHSTWRLRVQGESLRSHVRRLQGGNVESNRLQSEGMPRYSLYTKRDDVDATLMLSAQTANATLLELSLRASFAICSRGDAIASFL